LTAEHDAISLATREYFSAITTLSIVELGDQPKFKNALALMPNIDCVIVNMYAMDNLNFGLDTLPNLRTLEISGSTINRTLLRDIAKLRHLERLQLDNVWDEADWDECDWDALCDIFAALPRLWFFSVGYKSRGILKTIRSSEKLRRAMRNITHFVVIDILVYCSISAIEILPLVETVKHVTVSVQYDERFDMRAAAVVVAEAKATGRELRSPRLRIDIFE
jgi:hypothetical protein